MPTACRQMCAGVSYLSLMFRYSIESSVLLGLDIQRPPPGLLRGRAARSGKREAGGSGWSGEIGKSEGHTGQRVEGDVGLGRERLRTIDRRSYSRRAAGTAPCHHACGAGRAKPAA